MRIITVTIILHHTFLARGSLEIKAKLPSGVGLDVVGFAGIGALGMPVLPHRPWLLGLRSGHRGLSSQG